MGRDVLGGRREVARGLARTEIGDRGLGRWRSARADTVVEELARGSTKRGKGHVAHDVVSRAAQTQQRAFGRAAANDVLIDALQGDVQVLVRPKAGIAKDPKHDSTQHNDAGVTRSVRAVDVDFTSFVADTLRLDDGHRRRSVAPADGVVGEATRWRTVGRKQDLANHFAGRAHEGERVAFVGRAADDAAQRLRAAALRLEEQQRQRERELATVREDFHICARQIGI